MIVRSAAPRPVSYCAPVIRQSGLFHHLHRGGDHSGYVCGVAGKDHGVALFGDVAESIDKTFGNFEIDCDQAAFTPQVGLASSSANTTVRLIASRSSSNLSRSRLPHSERSAVCASIVIAAR